MHAGNRRQLKSATSCKACILAIVLTAPLVLAGCGGGVSSTLTVPGSSPQQTDTSPQPNPTTQTSSATLAWTRPTTNVDGSQLTDLAGFKVYYGTTPGVYTSIVVGNTTSFRFDGLLVGTTYYFTVTAYDANGIESDYSAVVSKLIS
jgi:hypothetical protein